MTTDKSPLGMDQEWSTARTEAPASNPLPRCLRCGLIPEPATDFCGPCWYWVSSEREQLEKLQPTGKRLLKSLWYELLGPTWFSPYRQTWTVATNLLYAVQRHGGRFEK